jgi:DNA-binding NarL/FixJ family response regulator
LERIRVFLSTTSRMLHEMLTDIVETQPDMEIVGSAERQAELRDAVARTHPDIVIVTPSHPVGRRSFEELLYMNSRLKVLAVIDNNRRGILYELRPSRALLGEMSPASLLNAIRATGPGEGRQQHPGPTPQQGA